MGNPVMVMTSSSLRPLPLAAPGLSPLGPGPGGSTAARFRQKREGKTVEPGMPRDVPQKMGTYICNHVYVYIYIQLYTHIIYVYVYIYMYIYMYIYIYRYEKEWCDVLVDGHENDVKMMTISLGTREQWWTNCWDFTTPKNNPAIVLECPKF